jgi:ABC-type transport system involved in multi-copper enzyme maturation permease subunit
MTTLNSLPEAKTDAPAETVRPAQSLSDHFLRFEGLLDRVGDHLNPILVKEARQAMKSRQFVVTFSLLLIFGWLWTVIFVSFNLPAIFFEPAGLFVLTGYYVVLSVPLLIVVPYAAFRSLAGECEDGTYELLSITTLSARQIVLGKLGSAVLQMMVYYSALAPCIAFTYLLRGIDVITIGLYLVYSFLAALLLSIFGLMMATVTQSRHWQVLLSVVFVMALLVFTFIWDLSLLLILNNTSLPLDQADFWYLNLCGLSFYIPLAVLIFRIAAGQITFASENRSTPVRAILIVPHVLIIGWLTFYWMRLHEEEIFYFWAVVGGAYWLVVGAFLTGETAQLSPRAMRELPQSFAGRVAFTWFNPGAGTGYMFALLNLLSLMLMACGVLLSGYLAGDNAPSLSGAVPDLYEWSVFAVTILGYVAGYLGFTHLVVTLARRLTPVSMLATFLCHVIVVLSGILLPLMGQALLSWTTNSPFEYTALQLPNWAWTLERLGQGSTAVGGIAVTFIGLFGAVMLLASLLVAAREVEYVRQQAPSRVQEDEAQLHPAARPVKKSPWD